MTPLAYTIDQLKELGGPGRDKAYQEIKEGKLRAVKYGRRTRVLAADFEKYMASLPAIKPKSPTAQEPAPQPARRRRRRSRAAAARKADELGLLQEGPR